MPVPPMPHYHPLGSPVTIIERTVNSTSSPRRRQRTVSHLRRRRNSSRVECRVEPTPHVFDQLPWISALECAPQFTNPWDIADLSQIPDPFPPDISSSTPASSGPVRRRKTSLRSNPISSSDDSLPNHSASTRDTSLTSYFSPSVTTPRSRFNPSRILFQNLMPVSHDPHQQGPNQCIPSFDF